MAQDENRKQRLEASVIKSLQKRLDDIDKGLPDDLAKERYQEIVKNSSVYEFTREDIDTLNQQLLDAKRQEILAKREAQETANPLGARTGRATMKDGGKFPDLTGDGKVTRADVLKGRGVFQDGGDVNTQMEMMLGREEETPMLPDEEMEEDYVDYVVEETLSNEDRNYLIDALEKDDRLSEIFDQVVESATEFTGSGTVEGPGTGRSDSIPARLSDGEFVITAKATKEIGADNLMSMMKDAEAAADERQMAYNGGPIREEKEVMASAQEPIQQNINVTKTTLDSSSAMQLRDEDPVKKAVKENMMLDPYQKHVRS